MRCADVYPGQQNRPLLSIPDRLLHPHLRTLVPRNQFESLYPQHGRRIDRYPQAEPLAGVQPDRIAAGHVLRDAIHPGANEPARHGRTGTTLGRRIRSGQSRRPKCPDHSLCDCRIGYFGSFLPDIFHQNAEKRR